MNRITKTFGVVAALVAMVSVPLIAKAAMNPSATGGNPVKVSACTNLSGGITITHASGQKYNLMNGNKDAGHGFKHYTYNCTSSTQYYVSWKPVVTPPVIPVQPEIASLEVLHKMPNTGVPRAFQSYKNGLSFGTPLTYQLVKNNLTSVLVKATGEQPNSANNSYAFAWTSSKVNTQMYTEAKVSALAKTANFQSSNEYLFTISDYYRDKYSMLVVFVRNNDGISAVPNMPAGVEVDDVIPVFLRFESKIVPAPTPTCVNKTGNGPLISLCLNSLFTHENSGILIQPTSVQNDVVTLKFHNATRTNWTLGKNQSVHLVSTSNQREIELTYIGKTPTGMLRFSVKDIAPKSTNVCQDLSGVAGTFSVCKGSSLTLEHAVIATVIFANNEFVLVSLANADQTLVYIPRHESRVVKATQATNRYYDLSYRGLDTSGKALLYVQIATIQ